MISEQDFLKEWLAPGAANNYWIGANDIDVDNAYEWEPYEDLGAQGLPVSFK